MSFIFDSLLFLVFCFFFLYLPGCFWLKKLRLSSLSGPVSLSLSFGLGISFFVASGLILGYLRCRFLTWPLFLGLSLFTLFTCDWRSPWFFRSWRLYFPRWFLFLFSLGIAVQVWINIFSGWAYPDGIRFWSAHGHDAVWHGSLMKEIAVRFPPRMLLVGGVPLKNYHYFVDILMGEFHRLGGFDPLDLYFRFFTFLFAALFLLDCFSLARTWRDEKTGLWAVFFAAFGGSFGYLITLAQGNGIAGSEAKFWVSQTNTAIGNPPQIAAFIIFLTFLLLFHFWCRQKSWRLGLVLIFLGGLITGFKIYAAATILAGLGVASVYDWWQHLRKQTFLLFLLTALAAWRVFSLTTTGGESFLVFQPWWFIRTMIVAGDRLNWIDLELKRQFYLAQNNWKGWLRILQYESLGLLIFFLGNLGTKVLGIFHAARLAFSHLWPSVFDVFLLAAASVAFFFPHVFVQRGVAWNTVQFEQYFLLLMGFLAAATVARGLTSVKKPLRVFLIFLLCLFSVPTVVANLLFFAPGNSLAIVENDELAALDFLNRETPEDSLILTAPFDPYAGARFSQQPRPISVWDGTAYVSYYAHRSTFIADEGQVEIMGYPEGQQRTAKLRELLFQKDLPADGSRLEKAKVYLKENKIDYLYLAYYQAMVFTPEEVGFEKVFENRVARIYRLPSL